MQATILLHFNSVKEIPLKHLKEVLLKDTILDNQTFDHLITPLLNTFVELSPCSLRLLPKFEISKNHNNS